MRLRRTAHNPLKTWTVCICDKSRIPIAAGVLVEKNIIVTCSHVVDAADPEKTGFVYIQFAANSDLNAYEAVDYLRPVNQDEDVAFLRFDSQLPQGVTPAVLAVSLGSEQKDFQVFGYPEVGQVQGVIGQGKVIGIARDNTRKLLQLDSPQLAPGFSGSPIMRTDSNRVIGIVDSAYNPPDKSSRPANLAYGTPTETLQEIYPDLRLRRGRPLLVIPLWLGIVIFFTVLIIASPLLRPIPPPVIGTPLFPSPTPNLENYLKDKIDVDNNVSIAFQEFTASSPNISKDEVTAYTQTFNDSLNNQINQMKEHIGYASPELVTQALLQLSRPLIGKAPCDDTGVLKYMAGSILVTGTLGKNQSVTELTPTFCISLDTSAETDTMTGKYRLGAPIAFDSSSLATTSFDQRTLALTKIDTGLRNYLNGEYNAAVTSFCDALQKIEEATTKMPLDVLNCLTNSQKGSNEGVFSPTATSDGNIEKPCTKASEDLTLPNEYSALADVYVLIGNVRLKQADHEIEIMESRDDQSLVSSSILSYVDKAVAAYIAAMIADPSYSRPCAGLASAFFTRYTIKNKSNLQIGTTNGCESLDWTDLEAALQYADYAAQAPKQPNLGVSVRLHVTSAQIHEVFLSLLNQCRLDNSYSNGFTQQDWDNHFQLVQANTNAIAQDFVIAGKFYEGAVLLYRVQAYELLCQAWFQKGVGNLISQTSGDENFSTARRTCRSGIDFASNQANRQDINTAPDFKTNLLYESMLMTFFEGDSYLYVHDLNDAINDYKSALTTISDHPELLPRITPIRDAYQRIFSALESMPTPTYAVTTVPR